MPVRTRLPGLAVARAAGLLLDWTATVGGSRGALPPGSRGGSRDALPPDTVGRFGRLTFGRPLLLAEKSSYIECSNFHTL